jgi:GNAT superfamily N-acetyltransferase
MAIEDLREIGNVLYERRADGMLYPVRRVRPDTEARGVPPQDPSLLNVGGIAERLALLNQTFNPVEGIGGAMRAGERLFSQDADYLQRIEALGSMMSGVAGIAAPIAAARAIGVPAASAMMEGLLGFSPTTQAAGDTMRAAGRDIVDRLNQPGPVPVMYSNPIPGVGRSGGLDDVLRARYPDVKISVSGDASKGYTLNRIDVPKSQRNSGIGTQIMQDLVDAVDAQGATLKLSPSGDFGGSVPRLKEFYKRFGFVENKGKAKDYAISESMYRTPKPPAAPTLPTPRNEAEAMARDILQLRAEGRADEVTEQMMDAADDQYMYFNTPLPMDAASRMARAERAGFRPDQPLYRGDANPNMQAFNTGQFAREGIGVTASDSPSVASTYMTGNNPAMYPLYARAENPLMVDVGGRNWTGIPAEAETNYGRLNDVLPPENYLDEDNLFDLMQGSGVDWGDGTSSSLAMANTDNVSRAAQSGGFDQIQFQNIVDRGGAGKYYTSAVNEPRTTVMTADPANVRSRFARFDPAFANLRNLSAGVGGAAVLTALGDDAEAGTPEMQIIGLVNQAGIAGAAEALGVSRRDIEEAISIVLPPSQWDQLVVGPQ